MCTKGFELYLVDISSSHYTICCLPCQVYINKWISEISILPKDPFSFEEGKFRDPNAIYGAGDRDNLSNISPGLDIFSHTTGFKIWTYICK